MKAFTQAKAWLAGLVLGLLCAVCGAQAPAPAAAEPTASNTAATSTALPANIPLRRESDAPVVRSGQWAMAFWALLAVGGVLWVLARRRRAARTAGQGGAGWANWLAPAQAADGSGPQIKNQTRLTPRHSLHAVQWRGTEYLIACSEHGMQLIAQHPSGMHRAGDGES